MKAILLAAGFATRLYPLTRNQAKPLLQVGGKAILSHLLDRLEGVPSIDQVTVVCNQRFYADFENWRDSEPRPWPIQVLNDGAANDNQNLGAIRDMQLAMQTDPIAEDYLVAAGDNLIDFDLQPFAQTFQQLASPLLLLRQIPPPIPPARYNEVAVDDQQRVISFREKPQDPQSDLASICLYFLPRGIENDLECYLEQGGNPDAPGYFLEWLVQQRAVHARSFQGSWFDIGNKETLAAARAAWVN